MQYTPVIWLANAAGSVTLPEESSATSAREAAHTFAKEYGIVAYTVEVLTASPVEVTS